VKSTGTACHSWDSRQVTYDVDGKAIPSKDYEPISEMIWNLIEEAMEYSDQNCTSIPASVSLWDYLMEKANELFPEAERSKSKEHFRHEAEMWGAFVGSSVKRQSLKHFWMEKCLEGENPFVSGTYQKVLQQIATPALKQADLKLNTQVVRVDSDALEHAVLVETADGATAQYDQVVLTTPLGWLKRNKDQAFVPPLPAKLRNAIENISYGTLDKVRAGIDVFLRLNLTHLKRCILRSPELGGI
jgi:hypothetical protein